jgi:hypothetical protein
MLPTKIASNKLFTSQTTQQRITSVKTMIMEFSHQDHDPIASHMIQRRPQVEEVYKGVVPPRSWTQVASHTK